ncbi:MAG: hypothetical protein JWP89_4173 [Schlesneria sp.]|nr:hypothetical protein [Schlesneria sp.]
MSFSSNRRDAFDPTLPLDRRASHVRSCAMLVGQKWHVARSIVIEHVLSICDIDLATAITEQEIVKAMAVIENLRQNGLSTS